jgi:hypothetical protein
MIHYRELYLVSKKALVYDILFNHLIFHSGMCLAILAYSFGVRKINDKYIEDNEKIKI